MRSVNAKSISADTAAVSRARGSRVFGVAALAVAAAALVVAAVATLSGPAVAKKAAPKPPSGTAHAEVFAGKNIACFEGHFHYGSSTDQKTKKIAEAEAIASWEGFVAFEYGAEYGDWRISAEKSLTCAKDGFKGWGCKAWSRPCHRVR